MRIDAYSFGRIVVDGEPYSSDVILLPDRVIGHWRRREGHRLAVEDLQDVVAQPVTLLVIGTGMYGRMEVPGETVRYLKQRKIDPLIGETREACRQFNEQAGQSGVVGAFHLTC